MQTVSVYGFVATALFQKCTEAAEYINERYGDLYHITVCQEVPRDYRQRRGALVQAGHLKLHNADAMVVSTEGKAAPATEFLEELQNNTTFRVLDIDPADRDSYENRALYSWLQFLHDRGNSYCWMDVTVCGERLGRVTFELYRHLLPRTCQNFWRMCRGGDSVVPDDSKTGELVQLSYKGTTFFRVMKDAWVMGGDVTAGHGGNSGYSCYGRYFPDESFAIPHDAPGILGMCNDGAHTNASAFYITRKRMSWMNGRYVAFGRVIDGMEVVNSIHAAEVKHSQAPRDNIVIEDCGVLDVSM